VRPKREAWRQQETTEMGGKNACNRRATSKKNGCGLQTRKVDRMSKAKAAKTVGKGANVVGKKKTKRQRSWDARNHEEGGRKSG